MSDSIDDCCVRTSHETLTCAVNEVKIKAAFEDIQEVLRKHDMMMFGLILGKGFGGSIIETQVTWANLIVSLGQKKVVISVDHNDPPHVISEKVEMSGSAIVEARERLGELFEHLDMAVDSTIEFIDELVEHEKAAKAESNSARN